MTREPEPPSVSVVVPFHRAERYLERCLAALLEQEYPRTRFEIISVDNGSSDASAALAARYADVRLVREATHGAYSARNRGWREARGEIVVFVDADCVPRRDWLRRLVERMHDPEIQVAVGRIRPGGRSRSLELLASYEDEKARYIFAADDPTLYVGHAGNMAVRTAIRNAVGPFLEHARGSDTMLVRRVVDAWSSRAVEYAPAAEVRHLELRRVRDYLRKLFLYGRSSRDYRRVSGGRPLSHGERLLIFRSTVRVLDLRPTEAALLLGLLTVGLVCWSAGTGAGMLRGARSSPPPAGGTSGASPPGAPYGAEQG